MDAVADHGRLSLSRRARRGCQPAGNGSASGKPGGRANALAPRHARITILPAAEPYGFLYEGTPHRKLDREHGYLVLSSGERRPLAASWAEALPAPEWLYFANDRSRRVLYLGNHQDDAAADQYWPMEGNMTVFGFGRQFRCCGRFLTAAPAMFTVDFAEWSAFAQLERAVNAATRPVKAELRAVESR